MEEDRVEYMNYRGHKIAKTVYPKQSKEFYEALENGGDAYMAHMFHIPPYTVPWVLIQSRMRHIDLLEDHKEEMKRIGEMPKEVLECEFEAKYGVSMRNPKRKKFLGIF